MKIRDTHKYMCDVCSVAFGLCMMAAMAPLILMIVFICVGAPLAPILAMVGLSLSIASATLLITYSEAKSHWRDTKRKN